MSCGPAECTLSQPRRRTTRVPAIHVAMAEAPIRVLASRSSNAATLVPKSSRQPNDACLRRLPNASTLKMLRPCVPRVVELGQSITPYVQALRFRPTSARDLMSGPPRRHATSARISAATTPATPQPKRGGHSRSSSFIAGQLIPTIATRRCCRGADIAHAGARAVAPTTRPASGTTLRAPFSPGSASPERRVPSPLRRLYGDRIFRDARRASRSAICRATRNKWCACDILHVGYRNFLSCHRHIGLC